MATTVRIEIDSELLARLRNRHPGKPDRELIEDLARIELGFGALADIRGRNAMSEPEDGSRSSRVIAFSTKLIGLYAADIFSLA